MNKYYWLFAGLIVGVFSIFMAYVNLSLIKTSDAVNDFNYLGIVVVIAEYAVLVYLLSFGQKLFKKK